MDGCTGEGIEDAPKHLTTERKEVQMHGKTVTNRSCRNGSEEGKKWQKKEQMEEHIFFVSIYKSKTNQLVLTPTAF